LSGESSVDPSPTSFVSRTCNLMTELFVFLLAGGSASHGFSSSVLRLRTLRVS